jgi:hypothetical protein
MRKAAGHAGGTAYAMIMAAGEGPTAEPPDRQEQVVRFWSEGVKKMHRAGCAFVRLSD